MGKPFSVLAAAAFALSIVAGGCARDKAPSPSDPPKKEGAATGKNTPPKVGMKLFTGRIEALDAAAGTLTLKGPKGAMDFKADERTKKDLDGMKIGDKVIVKHTNGIALSVVNPGANKNTQAGKEKDSALKEAGPVPQSE